jgi:hypothetical protein
LKLSDCHGRIGKEIKSKLGSFAQEYLSLQYVPWCSALVYEQKFIINGERSGAKSLSLSIVGCGINGVEQRLG